MDRCTLKQIVVAISLLASLFTSLTLFAATFVERMMSKPAIPHPNNPFVKVFFVGGTDNSRYGFSSDGVMTQPEWQMVLNHVGYLHPYGFAQANTNYWKELERDVPLLAAQSIGREYAGSIGTSGYLNATQKQRLSELWSQPLTQNMMYIFHDMENLDLGVPGGSGLWRLRMDDVGSQALIADPHSDFDVSFGRALESFVVSFGAHWEALTLARAQLISSGDTTNGWVVDFYEKNSGFRFRFCSYRDSNKACVDSERITGWPLALNWQEVNVIVTSLSEATISVAIQVQGYADSTANIPRPGNNPNNGLKIAGSGVAALGMDDLILKNSSGAVIAQYSFEQDTTDGTVGEKGEIVGVTTVNDISHTGGGHTLNTINGSIRLLPINGAVPATTEQFQTWFVDELLAQRSNPTPPKLITTWKISDRLGRLAYWSNLGVTHGNAEAYVNVGENPGPGLITRLLNFTQSRTEFAWEDLGRWHSVWLGNKDAPPPTALEPEDYQSLITMLVLQGNRWFPIFTPMSHGHLGSSGLTLTQQAEANADAFYAMATTARWFQSTSSRLVQSMPEPDLSGLTNNTSVVGLARKNTSTGEIWFGGYTKNADNLLLTINFGRSGTVTDLSTQTQVFTTGNYQLEVSGKAKPLHFMPY